MSAKQITYFGQPMIVDCDRNCKKAWGINTRPRRQLSDNPDDFMLLADGELEIAPDDPGTYEGVDGKPASPNEFPNRWCVRECERCAKWRPGETPKYPNLNYPLFNIPRWWEE